MNSEIAPGVIKRAGRFLWRYGITLALVGVLSYQLAFTWIPLWINASQIEGLDVSGMEVRAEDGRVVSLEEFRGSPLILNFWATWCLPCRVEIPQLADAYPELKIQGKQLLAINMRESWKVINRFRADTEMPFPIFRDEGPLAEALGIQVIPAMVVIDEAGRVVNIINGYRPWVKWYLIWWI